MEKLHITVRVQPKARRTGVEKVGPSSYRIRVQAAPEKGAANREVIDKIAAHFGISPSRVRIVRGAKSRNKVILVERRDISLR